MKKYQFSKVSIIYLSLLLVITLCTASTLAHVSLANAKVEKSSKFKATLTDAYGEALKNYRTEFTDKTESTNSINVDSINVNDFVFNNFFLSTDKVEIENNGESVFVDLVGLTSDGSYVNLSQDATWISDDMNVVYADFGRFLAQGKGKATVVVTFGNYKHDIEVIVKNNIDIEKKIDEIINSDIINSGISLSSLTDTERDTIRTNASRMCSQKWTPTSNIRGWRDKFTFTANTEYTGLPYSQTEYQCNETSFMKNLNNSGTSGFYNNYTRNLLGETKIMPKYGNDCSGLVSFSWNIPRNTTSGFLTDISKEKYPKVGIYPYEKGVTEPPKEALKGAYRSLKYGDAVVTDGHAFIIAINSGPTYVYCYEQTPYIAQYTIWTYDQLADGGYKPFSKK